MKPESTTRPDVSTGRRTFILVVVLLAMTVGAMCLNKVAPIATTIVSGMGLASVGQTGLLISVFTLSGIVLYIRKLTQIIIRMTGSDRGQTGTMEGS